MSALFDLEGAGLVLGDEADPTLDTDSADEVADPQNDLNDAVEEMDDDLDDDSDEELDLSEIPDDAELLDDIEDDDSQVTDEAAEEAAEEAPYNETLQEILARRPEVRAALREITPESLKELSANLAPHRLAFESEHPDFADAASAFCEHRMNQLLYEDGLTEKVARAVYAEEMVASALVLMSEGRDPYKALYHAGAPLIEQYREERRRQEEWENLRKVGDAVAGKTPTIKKAPKPSPKASKPTPKPAIQARMRAAAEDRLMTSGAKMTDKRFMEDFDRVFKP